MFYGRDGDDGLGIVGYLAVCAGALLLLYLLAVKPAAAVRVAEAKREVRYYAHRGLYDNSRDVPENSMRAFQRALEAGYGMEMDIRLTRDGIPVVFHDSDLKRMCGAEGRIEDMNWKELSSYRLLQTDQGIPRFEDVLALVDGKVPLLIEYKMDSNDASICICAERLLNRYRGKYCVESFHPFALLWYRHNQPGMLRGMLSTDYAGNKEHSLALLHFMSRHLLFNFFTKPDFISYDCRVEREISRTLCRKLYRSCRAAWTVKSREQLEQLKQRGEYDWFIFEGFRP